jgi:transposase-like protein
MRKTTNSPGEKIVKDIQRATRKQYSSEEKIRIVLDGLRGEDSIAELCRREGISQGVYYKWSKDFMEARKKRLVGRLRKARNPRVLTPTTSHNLLAGKWALCSSTNLNLIALGPQRTGWPFLRFPSPP